MFIIGGSMKLKYAFKTAKIEEKSIAVPRVGNDENFCRIIRLNKSAAEIFHIVQHNVEEEAVIEILLKRYDISYEQMRIYIHKFIEILDRENMLEYEKVSESVTESSFMKDRESANSNGQAGGQMKHFAVPEIEIIEYDFNKNSELKDGKHSHCKSPFGRDHSHE